jgi:hypothetical protein
MNEEQKMNNILINENAYFYKNIDRIRISRTMIEQVFRDASSVKTGNYLLKIVRRSYPINENSITYSLCVFKYESKPTFIDEEVENWIESKLAYLLIVEVHDYIVISRKNISKVQEFIKQFQPLDYTILSTLFVNENTSFEKFSLKNLNVSDKALREKSLEALDLRENFSSLGANNYMLNSLRVKNEEEKTSLMLNSSRINKFGKKSGIEQFCNWSYSLVNRIKEHIEKETFLSVFAEPQDYESMKDSLNPISILFIFSKLYDDFENGRIVTFFIRNSKLGKERRFNLIQYLDSFERLLKIEKDENVFRIKNTVTDDLELKMNNKSITLQSLKLKNIILQKDDGYDISFIDYINKYCSFILNFENIDLVYSNRKLFKDSKLLGNIEHFIKIFIPFEDLANITSEKGNFTINQTQFADDSIFNFVEKQFLDSSEFFICDDLGREWADHIGITEDRVTFYLSKYKDSSFSATAFQDIIGQAQKNLGNLTPQNYQLMSKRDFWNRSYPNSNISRLRKGDNIDNFIHQYQSTIKNPYLKRECYLVINFISKAELQNNLNQLKGGINFAQKNETIQILWFISSLVSSCKEVNIDAYICCKP